LFLYFSKKTSLCKGVGTLNIGLFTDTYFPQINGVGTSVHTLYKELTDMGHNVYIFTPKDPNRLSDNNENIIHMSSIPCFFLKNFRMGIVYPPNELLKIRALKLDIVHTQTEFSLGMFGKILAKVSKVPLVHTYHTMYEDYVHYIVNGALISRSMAHSFSRIFCNSANAVIAPTPKVEASLLDYGVTRPISVIPTGIDTDKFKKENYSKTEVAKLRKSYGFNENTEVLLVLGRIAQEKSIDKVLNAMPELFEKRPNARLLIVGDGPYKEELEKLSESLKITDKVVFAGAKPWTEIGKYYQLGDVYISASSSETQGLTFVEAMAGGIPVIAKKDPCLDGLIQNGVSGITFEDENTLADLIASVFSSKETLAEISENAIISADRYSAHTFGRSVLALYKDVLAKRNGDYYLPSISESAHKKVTGIADRQIHKISKVETKLKAAEKVIKKKASKLPPVMAVKKAAEALINSDNPNGGERK